MNEKQILIIDAEPTARRSLADHLTECGYVTTTASDGAQGLARTRAESFNIVLVDLETPIVDGLEITATLKAEQPGLPVVILSGTGALGDAIAALRQGAWDYVAKPFRDMDEVVAVVESALETARLRAERDRYQRHLEQVNQSLEAQVIRQNQDLQAHDRELAALNRVSYAISDLLDLDTMLHRAIDAAMAVIEADGGVVRLLNPATQQLVIAITRGLSESYRALAQVIPYGQGTVGQVAQTGHPDIGRDWASDPWLAPLGETDGIHSYLCVPLRTGQRIVGTLEMATFSDRAFSSREIELVTTIGNQIGLAVARAQYAAELERANAGLRRLDTLREQFIQNVAHELRTPLALVHGYVEMLAQGDLSPDEQQTALGVASRRIKALVNLVHSITTLQDLDSEPLRMERVKPAELVNTAIRMAAQRALTAKVTLEDATAQDLPPFQGDFTRLAQALHQLLDNSCKFSPEGSTVTVTAQITPDTVVISVEDQGIGISPEHLVYIFDRFYQVNGSSSRRYGGTGLGLAIAKEICEAHGGRLTVQSVENRGSVFMMYLPRTTGTRSPQAMPNSL
jgi:signal transduction histidine kinase